ncbi:MAG: hypothetical protein GXP41_08540 [Chloroflexi bacterium]|nr:hypothetical protein [Chloroflexota bacterium]
MSEGSSGTRFATRNSRFRGGCAIVIAVLAICAAGVAIPPGRTAVEAALLVADVLPAVPVSPLELVTRPPRFEQVSYTAGGTTNLADLYRPPDDRPHSAIILALGFYPDYTEAPLAGLAQALAREGIVVMMPHSTALEQGHLAPEEVESLVAAFQYLRQRDFVAPDHVGFVGFCVGSSFAVLAAADERIAADVAFLHLFSGYYDLRNMVRAITTRTVSEGEASKPWEPDELVASALTRHLIEGLEEPRDRTILEQLLTENGATNAAAGDLSPPAQAVYRLLTNRDPAQVDALLGHLPARQKDMLHRLSPAYRTGRVQAKVFVMGDAGDRYIPAVETRRLAKSLASETAVEYTEFTIFEHVRPTRSLAWPALLSEAGRLFLHLARVLATIQG